MKKMKKMMPVKMKKGAKSPKTLKAGKDKDKMGRVKPAMMNKPKKMTEEQFEKKYADEPM